ncbi:MAG: DUF4349 domain-containing protein [Actinobacteria bacterium]|nr:DUF4349 domain-containing protein [Actinomycetota bacterium]
MKKKLFKTAAGILFMLVILIVPVFAGIGCSAFGAASPEEVISEALPGDYSGEELQKGATADYSEAESMAAEAPATTVPSDDSGSSELYTQAGSSDAATTQVISTKLIKNGYVQIEIGTGEFQRKFFEVASLAEKYNGYVSSSQSYSDSEGKMTSGSVILRIEKDNFDAVLKELEKMGTVTNVSINVQDVTQEYVDNESRLTNLEAQQKRLLDLMEKSISVKDSIEVQRELSNVEGQIEVIKGRQNYLDNLIAYSTIEVYLSEPVPITDSTEGGFIDAVKRGARGALTVLRVVTMVLIGMSPILVLAGIILIIVWQSIRARNRRRARANLEKSQQQNK